MSTTPNLFPQISGYTISEQLYIGSRTAVYQATQNAENRPVTIKVLRQDYPSFSELAQFRNQYTVTQNLPISGIVRPLSLEPLGSGCALVMEYWDGISLDQYIQQQPLSLAEVLGIALQLSDILRDLHQHRIIHKDIKPANILIHPTSKQIKVIDFSIASLLPKETQESQSPNLLEGTLAYLSPEQTGRMNRGVDYRADFYALGVSLYQLLSGTLPFVSDDPLALVHAHIAKRPVPLNQVNAEVPEMVAAIVAKLMAKNAEDRYQSARGLKQDLEQCLYQWKESGDISAFELGTQDVSDRFLIPERLYGREDDVQTLLAAFDRATAGACELMLIAGFFGIGKTAVVNEVHKPIMRQRGYFIKGKFDQFNRDRPLLAFAQALQNLIEQLCSESESQRDEWRKQILAMAKAEGQVLIEVMPELEQIIGKQPNASELSGAAAQNRFNRLFRNFIEIFSTVDHPLVLFLDDLQWADSASLQLIKLLINSGQHLLILGAYRDNEISPGHPFVVAIEDLKKANQTVSSIILKPLTFDQVNSLVADTLNCSADVAQPLGKLIYQKAQRNPFFTTQFLKALHEDRHIVLTGAGKASSKENRRCWTYDIDKITELPLSSDVVKLMSSQLQKLSAKTQQLLQLAACIGNQFDLATLAIVSEQSQLEAANGLWEAVQEGLIVPKSQAYRFFQAANIQSVDLLETASQETATLTDKQTDAPEPVNPTYRFLHDRVQQAAYAQIPDAQKEQTHLKIRRLLQQNQSEAEYLFEILGHLNRSLSLITDPIEQRSLIHLNLAGAQRAKAATAYSATVQYARIAINLLPADSWQNDSAAASTEDRILTLTVYEAAAEALFLNTDYAATIAIAQTVLAQSDSVTECIKSYQLLIQSYAAQDQQLKAIESGLAALIKLGVPLVENPQWQQNPPALPDIDSIGHQPQMKDPIAIAALNILIQITPSTHRLQPELFPSVILTLLELCDRSGYSEQTAYIYGVYGLLLYAVIGDPEKAYLSGRVSLALADYYQAQYQSQTLRAKINMLFSVFVCPCKDPGYSTLSLLAQGTEAGLAVGDIEYVSWCIMARFSHLLLIGQPLDSIEQYKQSHLPILKNTKQAPSIEHANIWIRAADELAELDGFDDNSPTDAEILNRIKSSHNYQCVFAFHTSKLISCYLLGESIPAIAHALLALEHENAAFGVLVSAAHTFYHSLALLSQLNPQQNLGEHKLEVAKVVANRDKIERLAKHAPSNFQHKLSLITAEIHRIKDQKADAIALYDQAIAEAKASGYLQEEAIANELAAKFYLAWNKENIAGAYLTQAYYSYTHWGAKAKVRQLERRYPKLLAPILRQQPPALTQTETSFSSESLSAMQTVASYSQTTSSTTQISTALDLTTLLKASQALSREIHLDKLLATLLHTVLENAGADKAVFLMPSATQQTDQWFVEAIAILDQPVQIASTALPVSTEIPHSLINEVKENLQPAVVIDATIHPTLSADAYIVEQQPRSLLCTPILQQGKLAAILYLENSVAAGAFTRDRVELLNFLCAQAAISLENARLYQQAQAYSQQLEHSQLQIVQGEKMASLGNLVAGVAHEINNPIEFLNGSISNSKLFIQDLIEHIELYQQHYPHPADEIQDHAEEIDLAFISDDFPKLINSMGTATDRIKAISKSLRTFARADSDDSTLVDVHDAIDSTLLILKYRLKPSDRRPAIQIKQQYGDVPLVDCFPGQLGQVWMNILANAIDMFDELAQEYSFKALTTNPQIITIRTSLTTQNTVNIQICDNGKGMSEAVSSQIFDHLFTTKAVGKGTGLGLAIAHQIVVTKHGGTIETHSKLGQGTEFSICLPLTNKLAQNSAVGTLP